MNSENLFSRHIHTYLEVYNHLGKQVLSDNIMNQAGLQYMSFDFSILPAGSHIIKTGSGNYPPQVLKLVKR